MDKNSAVIEFLMQCPAIRDNPLFFNFINAKDNNKQIITQANDKTLQTPFIDGSVLKRYSFTIIDFKSVSYNSIVNLFGYSDENVEEFMQVQDIIDWVTEQAENRNYPDFGDKAYIEEMTATTENPSLNGVDTNVQPALAKYSVTIQIDYIDYSKKLWEE